VYLPKWKDTLAWAERDPEFLARLKTGYPRFFIPRAVLELSRRVLKKATPGPGLFALLLSSYEAAEACHAYLQKFGNFNGKVLHVKYSSDIEIAHQRHSKCHDHSADIYAVTYTEHVAGEAKAFWQHTGSGISGRCAVYWLEHGPLQRGLTSSSITPPVLPFEDADRAVQILRKRIARDLSTSSIDIQTGDVFLYPTGMSAIKNTVLGIQKLSDHEQKPNRVAVFG
jgi:cystathionine gamma-synthase